MFKYLFEFILIVIIIFFVWNILKRIFFQPFYQGMTGQQVFEKQKKQENQSQQKNKQNLNWDAETVEYEEIKEEKNK
ncbi:hypothetical protein HZP50_15175 [Elizabethkingia anophelis]|nr:hypothetical protein [Elizabethkingia anophelis]MDV3719522.1 hypothetical protein [Elizabethkingia anophelis]